MSNTPSSPAADTSQSQDSKDGFLDRFWNGELSLVVSFWIIGGLGTIVAAAVASLLVTLVVTVLGPSSPLKSLVISTGLTMVAVLVFLVFTGVGIWRSAERYTGPRIWRFLAQLAVALSFARIIISLVLLLIS